VEHLLAHRSGIGDHLDEEDAERDVTDYVLPVPVHELVTTDQYLPVLDGRPAKFPPGERFAYSNSGYVVLALIASGRPASRSPTSSSTWCADPPACTTPPSCAPTSSPAAPPRATSARTRGARSGT
jgi:hypothetical protein